jgi:hypothetical protein
MLASKPASVDHLRGDRQCRGLSIRCETDVPTDRKLGQEELADAIIRDCGDDPRAAVVAMLKINSTLLVELHALTRMDAAGDHVAQGALRRRVVELVAGATNARWRRPC